jgi:hypothetical protein
MQAQTVCIGISSRLIFLIHKAHPPEDSEGVAGRWD